ncbi:MAG: O-antigen ligase family protein [Owenweeksia sp.]
MRISLRNTTTNRTIIIVGLLVSLLNVGFILTEHFWGLLIPFGLALVAFIVLSLDKAVLFLVLATPLSVFYYNEEMRIGFSVPTEPILFGITILFILKLMYMGTYDLKVVRHPLSLAILFNLMWMVMTTITSEMPFVSVKYVIARIWFLSVFFYLMSQIFRQRKKITMFFWLYMTTLSIAAIYTLYMHYQFDFTRQAGTWVMFPFFKEHTVYGAILAMYIPIAFVFAFIYRHSLNLRVLGFVFFSLLSVAVIFSFTRAAWVSIAVAIAVMLLIVFRVRKEILLIMAIIGIGFLISAGDDLLSRFEKNDQVSSDNLTEHVESISNISSDVSNLERINRWKSAFRMFRERPIMGFGPGTYMFQYASYQKPSEKTIISTNAGDLGNAHSEYIGPLAESGVLGMLSVFAIVLITMITGIRVYYRLTDYNLKIIALAALMGLVTYWTHGFLNNFLDMDKAACPVWGFSALLVILDQYYINEPDKSEPEAV